MFRDMRRKNQLLPQEEAEAILRQGTSGVLSLLGDGGYPYGVPLSYVYHNGKLYFHCAKAGHKLDAIRRNCHASFCVIDQDQVVPQKYTSYFRSVIVFGSIKILEDEQEKRASVEKLAIKYAPEDTQAGRQAAIDREWDLLCMLEMDIEHMTGKQAIELARQV